MNDLFFEDFELSARYETYGRTITEADIATFCCFAGYHTPIFIDEEYAKRSVHKGRIAPSSLTMTVSTAMTESLFRTTVIALKAVTDGQFLQVVRPGDTIRTQVEVISKRETSKSDRGLVVLRDRVFNQRQELVFQIDKTVLIQRKPAASPPQPLQA
jgi:3-hydroxybutyryl-CoA dehydratase